MSASQRDERMTLYYHFAPHWKSIPAVLQLVHSEGELEHYKEGEALHAPNFLSCCSLSEFNRTFSICSMLSGKQEYIEYFTGHFLSNKHKLYFHICLWPSCLSLAFWDYYDYLPRLLLSSSGWCPAKYFYWSRVIQRPWKLVCKYNIHHPKCFIASHVCIKHTASNCGCYPMPKNS